MTLLTNQSSQCSHATACAIKKFWYTILIYFNKFELNLTYEKSTKSIQLLDVNIFIANGQFHTKAYRKKTACSS